jgi:hypothetical protein
MEYHVRPGERVPSGAGRIQQFAELTPDRHHPLVRGEIRGDRRTVQQRHPPQRPRGAAGHVERAKSKQFPGQPGTQKAGTADDQHVRHGLSRLPVGLALNTVILGCPIAWS